MKTKIIFVNWPILCDRYNIPNGLLNLAEVLTKTGKYHIHIIDYSNLVLDGKLDSSVFESLDYEVLSDIIINEKPDIIGFSTIADAYHLTLQIAKYIKEKYPEIINILGGPQITATAYESFLKYQFIDFALLGECEMIIEDAIDSIVNHREKRKIPNLVYRNSNKIVINPKTSKLVDLNLLPKMKLKKYLSLDLNKISELDIEAGRGCPYNCYFCATNKFWNRKFRLKSIDVLVSDIQYYISQYNIKKFQFQHDIFTLNKKFIIDFSKEIQKREINIKWRCSARLDSLDADIINAMSDAGCVEVFIGIETGSERMQEVINKKLDLGKINLIYQSFSKHQIRVDSSFIYGFPEENYSDLLKTLNLIKHLKENYQTIIMFEHLVYYPGTLVAKNYINDLKLYYSDHITRGTNFSLLSIKLYKSIFINFYENPTVLTTSYPHLNVFINSFINLLYYLAPNTYNLIMSIHIDYLKLYKDFEFIMPDFLDLIYKYKYHKVNKKSYCDIFFNILNQYISIQENAELLYEAYSFDYRFYKYKIDNI
jgi:radical SAM superfamily enzyme YgiQ (UPF0313 family)